MDEKLFDVLKCLIKTHECTDLEDVFRDNICDSLSLTGNVFNDIVESSYLNTIHCKVSENDGVKWKFVCTLCHTIICIKNKLDKSSDDLLSLRQQKTIESSLQFIISMGILPSLLPGVGISIDKRSLCHKYYKSDTLTPMESYTKLKVMCYFLTEISKCVQLKAILFSYCLGDYLSALYQLGYAPISKPNSKNEKCGFLMSEELWQELQSEQIEFRRILKTITSSCHRPLVMKELIILQGGKDPMAPLFIRKACSKQLSEYLTSSDGLVSIIKCFLDTTSIDTGTQWKHIEIISQIVCVKHGPLSIDEYLINICSQLSKIIHSSGNDYSYTPVAAACLRKLYEKFDNNTIIDELIKSLIAPFLFEANDNVSYSIISSSRETQKLIDTLNVCFVFPNLCLPICLITPIMYNLFALRANCSRSMSISIKLNEIILKHFSSNIFDTDTWFSIFIFRAPNEQTTISNDVIFEKVGEDVQIKRNVNFNDSLSVDGALNCLVEIIKDNPESSELACKLFTYCLTILSKKQYNGAIKNNPDPFIHGSLDKDTENNLIVTKTLETLSNIECVLDAFKKNPIFIAEFIQTYLSQYNDKENVHTAGSEECLMIILILLSTLLSEKITRNIIKVSDLSLTKSLNTLKSNTTSEELKFLCNEVVNLLSQKNISRDSKFKSKFENAISEISDPLLPIRAHGLMQLSKLLSEKDPETVSKKYLVQCIFQENLKNTDSYIYLTAINGMASVANHCTEDVLGILTDEFMKEPEKSASSLEQEENVQTRIKIGEVLVKITKNLGETALLHKNVLLNTFLNGCRDNDDLIRASSLSNLAEVSRVMSYNLGTVVFEILKTIDNILEFDKSPDCRRAAVLVISSLLKGLGKEALSFLKDALLPLYRTLKRLYCDEKEDDVVRLHSQIALEELNNIVKDLLFTTLKHNKKSAVLD